MAEIDINVSASLTLIHELRSQPLKSRGLERLRSKAEKLIAMDEAERVINVLHQVRANLSIARQTIKQLDDPQLQRRDWIRIVAATQSLLRSVQ